MATVNLAKLDHGLVESPTVMVGEDNKKKLGKNRGILKSSGLSSGPILKPSWGFVETNIIIYGK